mgnify:CR=1 FL=1
MKFQKPKKLHNTPNILHSSVISKHNQYVNNNYKNKKTTNNTIESNKIPTTSHNCP